MRLAACAALLALAALADARPPREWVTVSGQVVLPPEVPLPGAKLLPNGAPDESVVVDAKTRGVKNVVVWLRPDDQNARSKLAPADFHPADARRLPRAQLIRFTPLLTFEPRILLTRVGDTVVVQNQAPVPANFFWTTANNGNVNVAIAPGQHLQDARARSRRKPRRSRTSPPSPRRRRASSASSSTRTPRSPTPRGSSSCATRRSGSTGSSTGTSGSGSRTARTAGSGSRSRSPATPRRSSRSRST